VNRTSRIGRTVSDLSRRDFLKAGSVSGAALLIGFQLGGDLFAEGIPQQERPVINPLNAWVKIDSSGQVTLVVNKDEIGQGVYTSLPMILAEELDVDFSKVLVEHAPTDTKIYDLGTGGSGSVGDSWMPLRRAGAAARAMLITAAAQAWNVPTDTCRTENGRVLHGHPVRSLGYGELVEAAAKTPVPALDKVPLKNHKEFHLIGTSVPRYDIPSKVNGSAIFGMDVRVPGMLYAVVARCPTFGGKPAKFDATKARALPGVRDVLEIPSVGPGSFTAGGIAVVADSTWAAMQGRKALEIEWENGPAASESSASIREQFVALAEKPGKVVRNDGDAEAVLANAAHKIEAIYELPFLAHATMEPMNGTVVIRDDGAEAWMPTQAPQWAQSIIAGVTGLPTEKVVVHSVYSGGGFGRRYQSDFAMEAVQIAKATGKPIHLMWTREDDMQHDFYRPATYQKLSAALDSNGHPAAWLQRIVSTSIRLFWDRGDRVVPERQEIHGAIQQPYCANTRLEYAYPQTRVPRAWWRSVSDSMNGFVTESFVDELAWTAKVDPLEYRLRLLSPARKIKNPVQPDATINDTARLANVVKLVKEKSGWGSPLAAGRGRGIASHFSFDTYVAQVAEVSVGKDGTLKVHRVVCAVDCGRVVNPDGAAAQAESAIVYGLTAALYGEITIDKGAVQQSNFNDYQMLRINEMPKVEVHFVPSEENPTGMGEPCVPPIAPAVTNAIYAATRKRIRRLPIRSEGLA